MKAEYGVKNIYDLEVATLREGSSKEYAAQVGSGGVKEGTPGHR